MMHGWPEVGMDERQENAIADEAGPTNAAKRGPGVAPPAVEGERERRALDAYLAMETALAKRILTDWNRDRETPETWPAGQGWDDLVQTSHETLWQAARREAGLPGTADWKNALLRSAPAPAAEPCGGGCVLPAGHAGGCHAPLEALAPASEDETPWTREQLAALIADAEKTVSGGGLFYGGRPHVEALRYSLWLLDRLAALRAELHRYRQAYEHGQHALGDYGAEIDGLRAELEAARAEVGRLTSWLRTIRGEARLLVREDDIEAAGPILRMAERALASDAGTRKEEG